MPVQTFDPIEHYPTITEFANAVKKVPPNVTLKHWQVLADDSVVAQFDIAILHGA